MIPLAILCDEYIDRSKLTEQKNTFEYIVSTLQVGRNNKVTDDNTKGKILFIASSITTNPVFKYENFEDNYCIMNNEPRAGSFLKQRISLAIQIANSACLLGAVNDKTTFDESF